MKITRVDANNRKRAFEVETRRGTYSFPYAMADPEPTAGDKVAEVFVDPELGREGFTYVLQSGEEGSVHVDWVLEYHEDPSYMANLALYELTVEARRRFEESGLSTREVAKRLGTSLPQLYRLLDTTNYTKSMRQLISLLRVLGYSVEVSVRKRVRRSGRPGKPVPPTRRARKTHRPRSRELVSA